jgi:HD-GYP domain-containing protein (c-di-GMP phosphodiesterase class II)
MIRAGSTAGLLDTLIHCLALIAGIAFVGWITMKLKEPAAPTVAQPDGYREILGILASSIDGTDPFTRGRAYRLSRFCLSVGNELRLSPLEMQNLEYAALLHDIGRTAIHYDIMYKPGKLNAKEREVVKNHPSVGYHILKGIPPLSAAADIIHAHHEQPDGKGYPHGLKGRDIPVASRIIMVAAAFDAMTSDRPYRAGLPPKKAYEELRDSKGTMFFPEVVEAFIKLHSSGEIFTDFSQDELNKYAVGEYSSRALEGHLANRREGGDAGLGDAEIPAA